MSGSGATVSTVQGFFKLCRPRDESVTMVSYLTGSEFLLFYLQFPCICRCLFGAFLSTTLLVASFPSTVLSSGSSWHHVETIKLPIERLSCCHEDFMCVSHGTNDICLPRCSFLNIQPQRRWGACIYSWFPWGPGAAVLSA